ncbi:chlorite dismutase [Streptomyces sp. SPB78]|nr:chlorite dismutase [Streptomyces sp. SPB78]
MSRRPSRAGREGRATEHVGWLGAGIGAPGGEADGEEAARVGRRKAEKENGRHECCS